MLDIADLADLKRLILANPEWREELRQLLLTEDLLGLPRAVRELAEAQRRTEARVEELAEAQRRTEVRVEELAEAQRRTEARVEELAEAQRRTEVRLGELLEVIRVLGVRQDSMVGELLEARYVRRAASYFGRHMRRLRVVLPPAQGTELDDSLRDVLAPEEWFDLLELDLLASGKVISSGATRDAWIAVEVSAVIDASDVERAVRRAALLRKAGLPTMAVVAGEAVTEGATAALRDHPVVLVLDGRSSGWEKAIAALP